MKLRITRLAILSDRDDLHAFQPGFVVDVDDATADHRGDPEEVDEDS